ncbi:MAG: L-threonylcarbamoyladenylate synthase [Eubacteriales bacterium]|jgi:L-threonylcarbamoyladenylate synthase
MKTIVLPVNPENIARAAEVIRQGGLVGMPTETVYGLAADATNPQAVEAIFAAKGRPQDNPLIVHIADFDQVERYTRDISPDAWRLMRAYWPGPMTVILRKREIIPQVVSCGLDTIGLRMPGSTDARAFIQACGTAIAAPSANLSGRPSTTTAQHVLEDLEGRIPLILDGGPCQVGVESTVIDLSGSVPTLLRPGGITLEQLRAVLPQVVVDKCIYSTVTGDQKVKSPGMKYRHYAPKAPVTILVGTEQAVEQAMLTQARQAAAQGETLGILCYNESMPRFEGMDRVVALPLGSRGSKEEMAHQLFDSLRAFDSQPVSRILACCPDNQGLGLAVVNRLSKAAGFHIVNVQE